MMIFVLATFAYGCYPLVSNQYNLMIAHEGKKSRKSIFKCQIGFERLEKKDKDYIGSWILKVNYFGVVFVQAKQPQISWGRASSS